MQWSNRRNDDNRNRKCRHSHPLRLHSPPDWGSVIQGFKICRVGISWPRTTSTQKPGVHTVVCNQTITSRWWFWLNFEQFKCTTMELKLPQILKPWLTEPQSALRNHKRRVRQHFPLPEWVHDDLPLFLQLHNPRNYIPGKILLYARRKAQLYVQGSSRSVPISGCGRLWSWDSEFGLPLEPPCLHSGLDLGQPRRPTGRPKYIIT